MRPKTLYILMLAVILAAGCTGETPSTASSVAIPSETLASADTPSLEEQSAASATVERLEIIHFHGTRQCTTCIAIGQYANDTLNTYFKDELGSGKITYQSINYDETGNKLIAMKYEAVASSLWVGTYNESGFTKKELRDVWYKAGDREAYMEYLKSVVEENLNG